jgi:transcriptional regulator with XRE-family HTH domain
MKYAKTAPLWSRIRKLRQKAELSQEGLARKAGITTASIAKIELGGSANPTIRTLARITRALGVSIDGLVEGLFEDDSEH